MPHQSNREAMTSPRFIHGSSTSSDSVAAPLSQAVLGSSMPFPRWGARLPQVTPRPEAPSPSSTGPLPSKQAKANQNLSACDSQEWGIDSSSCIDDSDDLDPTKIIGEYIAQQNAIDCCMHASTSN